MANAKANLYNALFAAQGAMPDLQKNAINPHFKNTYITLDSLLERVLPVLRDNFLMLTQIPDNSGSHPSLRTTITHVPTGESLEGNCPLVLDRDTPQAVGSAITYMRRYSLMSILGLVADEDDDAEAATAHESKKESGKARSF